MSRDVKSSNGSGRSNVIAHWFRATWSGSRGALVLIIVLSVGSAVLLTTFPWLWQFLVDEVREGADPVQMQELALWMALVGGAHFLLYLVLQGARSIMNARIQWRARRRLFDHLSQLDSDFYRRWRSGDLVTRLSDDAGEKISWFLCSGIFRTLEAILIVSACLIAMMTIDVSLTLWVILPLPLLILGQAFAQGALGRRYRHVQESISHINDELTSTFGGIRIVQACGLSETTRRRFRAHAAEQMKAEVRVTRISQAVHMMYGYGWQAAIVALLLAGGFHVIEGHITLGQYVSFEGFVMTLVWPMFDVGMFVSKYKQTFVALDRLQELMDTPPPPMMKGGRPLGDSSVQLQGATFVSHDGATLLEDIDLEVPPGGRVAIVGAVGSGKSVMMELLAGIRRTSSGSLRIGGESVTDLDVDALRARLSYVPQDPVLLSATLRENILLGREVSEDSLNQALKISRLAQDIPAFPAGLETEVGERGVTLSGGQQQRVALTRALVGRPTILLLDDATSALDADTEAAFWEQLEAELTGITIIVVTHRVATIQRAEQVIVLQDGKAVQTGTHGGLIEVEGEYRRIYGAYQAWERLRPEVRTGE